MSGGAYEYLYGKDPEFGPDMDEFIKDVQASEYFTGKAQIVNMLVRLNELPKRYREGWRLLKDFMHDYEWFQSGDYGFDEVEVSATNLLQGIIGRNKKAYKSFMRG
jgi:hypothetical protein